MIEPEALEALKTTFIKHRNRIKKAISFLSRYSNGAEFGIPMPPGAVLMLSEILEGKHDENAE